MTCRARCLASALASTLALLGVSGCTMDNPAFEGGDELADAAESSTRGDTQGDTQSEFGESSNDSTAPETSSESTSNATDAADCDPADVGSCGECMTCTDAGVCKPTAGVACAGESIQCSDYAFGLAEGTCYALQAAELTPKCSEAGECTQPDSSACAEAKGEPVLACDWRCVDNQSACAPGQYIGQLEPDDMCAIEGETNACQSTCSPFDEIVESSCSNGWCESQVGEPCLAFACNPLTAECFLECDDSSQCALDFVCEAGLCIPWLP